MALGGKKGANVLNMEKSLKVRNSRKIYVPIYIMIFILILTISFAKISGKGINSLALRTVLIFSAAAIVITEIHRFVNFYEINSNSLVFSSGFIRKSTRRLDLLSISDADSSQNLWERMLNYGDVHVRLFSKESAVFIKGINSPLEFVNFLIELIDKKRGGGR